MGETKFQILLEKYFQGKLDDNEHSELVNLLKDKSNLARFQERKQKWESEPEDNLLTKINWKRLSYKVNTNAQIEKTVVTPIRKWLQIASVAAVLLLGILIGSQVDWQFFGKRSISQQNLVFETPRGDKSKVTLPDGTEVWINANSKLVYHQTNGKERSVDIVGEALFKVSSNKELPFVVRTNDFNIRVLGTVFNVMAYDDFGRKKVTLMEGKINIEGKNLKESINPGEAFLLKDNEYQIVEGNASLASGWVNDQFNFKNISVVELMKRLENKYDIDIDLHYKGTEESSFTGTFKNEETIWQVLDALKVYISLDYERIESRKIKVMVY